MASALKLEAEDADDDHVALILEALRAQVLDRVEQLEGTDA